MYGGSTPTEPAQQPADYKAELVHIFNISKHLLRDFSKNEGLHLYYKKYQACLRALSASERMASQGEWDVRRPSETEIIELFVGKTMWHGHLKKTFSRVPRYPDMLQWLNQEEDALPDIEIWGEEKSSYTFKDLKAWLDEKDHNATVKDKGKGKERYRKETRNDDSDDSDSDEKKKKKKKKQEKEGSSKKHNTRSKGKIE